ncbi:heterokaryon incompatibility Het-C [Ramaria rubella]|nr:heterokaryon incompatibility Het-C [Ramaria rubella]
MPLLIFLIFLCLTVPTLAFGAGAIPNYAYLNEKAYRHGDIAEVLLDLVKHVGGGSFVRYTFSVLLGRNKFSKMDMQRVYFGNWLRDYSQAMDIAGLKELTAQTIIMVVSVLGFMTFGFATAEFEITPERLGVYLPVEHIDNPKGYGENEPEGDARQFHSALRPPVDPRELEINPHNGMKNYIATEGEAWDTSSAHVRRTLRECIALGRKANGKEGNDQYEAFRLLGTALHTLEDLLAHSNWCELALRKLGHKDVFCHVGDSVVIDTPNGPSPPLVTGTFGSADFIYSVLGEGMDRLSEASISNLAEKMDKASHLAYFALFQSDNVSSILKGLLAKLPSSGNTTHDEKMEQAENIKNRAYNFNPDDVAPEEIQHLLWHILEWRDTIYKDVLKVIGMVPGLSELFEELSEALNAFIYTILDPVLKPVLQEAKDALQEGSKAIIDNHDQYQVFDDPNASDPSHSMLAKDHFDLLLNDPAGKIAQVVVEHTVNWIVLAWGNEHEDVELVIDKILEVFHHPYFSNGRSHIQRRMLDRLAQWLTDLGPEKAEKTIQALTKESIREGKNKRFASSEEPEIEDDARIVVEEQTGTMQPVKVIVEGLCPDPYNWISLTCVLEPNLFCRSWYSL